MPGKGGDGFCFKNSKRRRKRSIEREPALEHILRMAELARSLAHLSQRELLVEHKVVNGVHSAKVTFQGLSSCLQPIKSAISKEHAFAFACYKLLRAICYSVISPKILFKAIAHAKSMEEVATRMLPAFEIFMRTIGDGKIGIAQKQKMGLKIARTEADEAISQYIEEERGCHDEPLSAESLEVSSAEEENLPKATTRSPEKKRKKSKDTTSSSESEPEKKPSVVKTEPMSAESFERTAGPDLDVRTSRRKIKIEAQSPPPSLLSEKTPENATATMKAMTEEASCSASKEGDSVKSTKKRKKLKSLSSHSEDEFEQKPLIKKSKTEPVSPPPEFGDEADTSDQAISNHKPEAALFAKAAASRKRWAMYLRILREKILGAKIASDLPAAIVSRVSCWMDGCRPRAYAMKLEKKVMKSCKEDANRDPCVEFFETAKRLLDNIFPCAFFELLLSLDNWDSISAVLENHGRNLVIDFRGKQMEKLRIGRARLLCLYDELFLTPANTVIVNSDPRSFEKSSTNILKKMTAKARELFDLPSSSRKNPERFRQIARSLLMLLDNNSNGKLVPTLLTTLHIHIEDERNGSLAVCLLRHLQRLGCFPLGGLYLLYSLMESGDIDRMVPKLNSMMRKAIILLRRMAKVVPGEQDSDPKLQAIRSRILKSLRAQCILLQTVCKDMVPVMPQLFDLSSPTESTKPRPAKLSEGKAPFDDESLWRVVLTHGVISAWWRGGEAVEWEKEHAEEMEQFSAVIHDHFLNNVQGRAEYEQKLEVFNLIADAAKKELKNFGVHFRIAGSTRSFLAAFNSDLNLCLMHPTDALDIDFARRIYPRLVEVLGSRSEITPKPLTNPHFLKFTARLADSSPPIPVGISYRFHAVHFSQLMALYERVDNRLGPLCLFIKHWLLQTTFYYGSVKCINSYLMTSLLIHFLQCGVSPPVLPCLHELYPDKLANDKILELDPMAPFDPPLPARENDQSLSSLLLGFFDYFSTFRFDEFYISIRAGRPIRLSNSKLTLPRPCEIVIPDPFDRSLITSAVGVVPLQTKMMEAAKEIRSSFSLSNVQV